MTVRERALQIAITQVGQKENPLGSNWGHPVRDYLASVGINFPAFWCVAFVYWCFDKAAKELGVPNPMPRTAGALDLFNKATKAQHVTGDPMPGDIGILDLGHGHGHGFIIDHVDPARIYNIEGNSNNDGSANGIMVTRHDRLRTSKNIKGYLRF